MGSLTIFSFDNSYARLPQRFYTRLAPVAVASPRLITFNRELARDLGLDADAILPDAAEIFSGNRLPDGADPIAIAYAGHQFGHFVPQLGDGRAILIGEIVDPQGRRRDIQLKGSGPTPYSRQGDGRAWLGPVLREYLISEAMHALGIPTTRSLAAVATGEPVFREEILPGAILTRVAASHIRVGTFEYFAARGDVEAIRILADHAITRHFPEIAADEQPFLALLEAVAEAQARLIARWMLVGFIHGVMNTDNMAISGETIDYGPCAFMDAYDPATVFSSIDHRGRYAFANQPLIAAWNLARLAECLLDFIDIKDAGQIIDGFRDRFTRHWLAGMREKLGLGLAEAEDMDLARDLLAAMEKGRADFTLTFRRLTEMAEPDMQTEDAHARSLFSQPQAIDAWLPRWRARLARDRLGADERFSLMRRSNPAYIPRNHRIEAALEAAAGEGDLAPFQTLLTLLQNPHDDQAAMAEYATPPGPSERVFQTFCGT